LYTTKGKHMNVGRYLRGEDRHVGTARTTQPQPPHRTEPLIGCVNHDCAKCKPLTDEQRQELMSKAWNKWLSNKDDGRLFAWDFSFEVEAAHGIQENT
jgi:hypothetical protein